MCALLCTKLPPLPIARKISILKTRLYGIRWSLRSIKPKMCRRRDTTKVAKADT